MKPFLIFMPEGMTPEGCVCATLGNKYPCGSKHCALYEAKPALSSDKLFDDILKWKHDSIGKHPDIERAALKDLLSRNGTVTLYVVENEIRKPV